MRKFSIEILRLTIWYNHYLSDKFIKKMCYANYFKEVYPLGYCSRVFDKPAEVRIDGSCFWWLNTKYHRVGKPAWIWANGSVGYYENGEKVK